MGAETELILPTATIVAKPAVKAALGGHHNDVSFDINNSEFPAGLRVLVVDDDPICLLILDRMLQSCRYKVTTCGGAIEALRILRENKNRFDVVISDVQMPDMDGFKLLELVGLEMDLPVIMMSSNGATSAVMKGIKHGACDYLLKPVRIEELRNIWQHVVRKKKKDGGSSDNLDDKRHNDAAEYLSNDGVDGPSKILKKRKEDDDDIDLENDDPSTAKKPRVVWSVELHQKFVNAVNQLGIDKAVPKRILELMDVRGLTRENVASHLQKYRLYLKRISEVPQPHQTGGLGSTILGSPESSFRISGAGFSDYVTKSSLQTCSLDRNCSPGLAGRDLFALRQLAAIHGVSGSTRASHALQSSNNMSATLAPSMSTEIHINQGLKIPGSFGQSENSLPAVADVHQLSSMCNMGGGIGPVVSGLDNCVAVDNANDTLLAQILQQQCNGNMTPCLGGVGNIGLPMASSDGGLKYNPNISSNDGRNVEAYYNSRAGLTKLTFPASSGNSHNSIKSADVRSLNIPYDMSADLSTPCITLDESIKVSDALDMCGSKNTASMLQPGGISVSSYMGPNNSHSWHMLIPNQNSDQKSSLALNQNYGQSFKMGSLSEHGPGQISGFQESDLYNNKSSLAALMGNQCIKGGAMFKEAAFTTKTLTGVAQEAFPLLDDALIMYAKQAHAGQSEGDFSVGKYALGNMHVK